MNIFKFVRGLVKKPFKPDPVKGFWAFHGRIMAVENKVTAVRRRIDGLAAKGPQLSEAERKDEMAKINAEVEEIEGLTAGLRLDELP